MSDYRERACTCHPDEAPKPCPQRYAYSECVLAAEIEQLRAELALYKQNYARKQLTDSERRELEDRK